MPQPPSVSASEGQGPFYVGVDLGGTNIKTGVLDDSGRVLTSHSIPTEPKRGPEEGARRMGAAICKAIADSGAEAKAVRRVGLASPGTMDIPTGVLIHPHNLPGWFDFPIRDRVAHHCGYPVTFANDANAAAFGEFWVGSGQKANSLVLFTLGTGIGCGIIVGDQAIDGQHSHGGECGHIIIDHNPNARLCGCGQTGHLEGYASALAVIKRTEEALAAGRISSVSQRLAGGEKLTPLLLANEAEAGDELSLEIILDTAMYLGVGAVTLIHTIDPDMVVLGGAMTFGGAEAELGRRFLARVRDEVRRRSFPVLAEKVAIDYAMLGSDAGFIGAAGLARLEDRRDQ